MVAHWLACVWYVIGLSEIDDKSTVSWLYALGEAINKPYGNFTLGSGPDEGSSYVTALYFTLSSMTTVGFGNVAANTNSEKVFAVVTMLIGGLLSSSVSVLHLCDFIEWFKSVLNMLLVLTTCLNSQFNPWKGD